MKWFGKYRQAPIEAGDRLSGSELPAKSAVGKAQAISSKRTVYKIKRLSQSVTKVAYGADQTETTTNQLLDGISTIGKQMDVQLKAVGQAVEIISEMGAASQEIAASVNEVAAGSSQTAVAVSRGKNAVQRSTDVMAEIQRIVEENAQAVRVLGEKTQQISKIVTTIKEIASQTNLLALNAAIEAARAGDAGRGFAVVADEVKKLAGNSSEAATQISRLIASIQADAKATVDALAQSVSSVTEGSRVVGETGQALDEIINAVDHSNRQVQDISEAVAEQAAHSDQLMQVADSIKSAVDKAAVFVETATFDAEQQQASLHTLLRVTRDLRAIQDGVEKEIGAAIEHQDQESKPYTFGLPADPVTFDPALSQDTNSNNVMREIFVGLLQLGQDGKPIPAIASSWHLEEDGRTYTLALRDDVYFHHGRQVEAKDAKYTLERIVSPATKSPRAGLFLGIEGAKEFADGRASEIRGIRVLDSFKLVIRLTTPNLRFLSNLANLAAALIPRDVMEQRGTEFTKNPVGAGPFVLEQWLPGDRIELRANTRYFEGRPYADRLVVKIYAGADALLDGFFHGEVGHLRIDSSGFDRLQSHPVYRSQFSKLEPVDVQYCGLNCVKPPFDNPLVRQAVNFAFDRQAYMQRVLKGHAVISRGALPPAMVANTVKEYTHDLAKAKELMRQAGFGNGYPGEVVLHVRSNNVEQATRAEAIAQALEQIGIHVQIKAIPWVDFLKGETMDQCHLYLIAATGGHAEGHDYLSTWFHTRGIGHSNFTRYSNPEVDRLLDESETIVSPQKRHEYYQRANAIIHIDAPWLFLFHPQYYMAKQPEVKGLAFRNNGDVFLKNVWLEDSDEVVS